MKTWRCPGAGCPSLSDLARSGQCLFRQIGSSATSQGWHVDHLRHISRSRAPQPYGPIPIQHRCRSTGLGDLPSVDGQHVSCNATPPNIRRTMTPPLIVRIRSGNLGSWKNATYQDFHNCRQCFNATRKHSGCGPFMITSRSKGLGSKAPSDHRPQSCPISTTCLPLAADQRRHIAYKMRQSVQIGRMLIQHSWNEDTPFIRGSSPPLASTPHGSASR